MTINRALHFLGWTHLLGGVLGVVGAFLPSQFAHPDYWLVIGMMLSGLSIASGLAILGRRAAALKLAVSVEGLQLVAFHTGTFGFQFYSGVQAILLLTPTRVDVSANIQSSFGIGSAMLVREPFVALDMMAFVFLWVVWRAARSQARDAGASNPSVVAA